MTYAFSFDARFCSGCKACQAACKDKNNLPTGVLWRRVIEVSGGTWQKNGEAWNNSVFAYNLSISCNHCAYPKCAGVCPTDAYELREDGIVFLDTQKCMGCGYCAWACPYGAPQYNADAGHMTKCDFCVDNLEQGLPPACVAACPMRVLDYGEMTREQESIGNQLALWEMPSEAHPYPLPTYSHTQPRLAMMPHPAMNTMETKSVANLEEIQPRIPSDWEELPLILFTLLVQLAVGGFWAMTWMFSSLWALVQYDATGLRLLPTALIGACLGAGMFASFGHLGTKKNAWRALTHVRKSSLSREILFLGLFGLSWLFTTLESTIWHRSMFEWMAITAILGVGLIYNMSQVYRIPAAPGWNTWRTTTGFMISALLLGISVVAPLLAYESSVTGIQVPASQWTAIGGSLLILLLAQLIIMHEPSFSTSLPFLRVGLILVGMTVSAITLLPSASSLPSTHTLLFIIIASEEALGRWLFYRSRI
jgi:anaerobic dimethyl sulfoxide reductase subunit B (iron-sulfur subunit)